MMPVWAVHMYALALSIAITAFLLAAVEIAARLVRRKRDDAAARDTALAIVELNRGVAELRKRVDKLSDPHPHGDQASSPDARVHAALAERAAHETALEECQELAKVAEAFGAGQRKAKATELAAINSGNYDHLTELMTLQSTESHTRRRCAMADRKVITDLDDWVDELELEDVLKADGFDDAVIGVCVGCAQPTRLLYDAERIIEILMNRDGMSREDAEEFFDFNIAGAHMGPSTPLYLTGRFPGYRMHLDGAKRGKGGVKRRRAH